MPTTVGIDAAHSAFSRLLRLIPDLRGEVHHWAMHPEGVFIEFTLGGQLAGGPLGWRAVDCFILRDGLAVERVSYFDSSRQLAAALGRPRAWPALLKSGMRPRRPIALPEGEDPGADLRAEVPDILAAVPDLGGHVVRRGTGDGRAFAELSLETRIGRRRLRWAAVHARTPTPTQPHAAALYFDALPHLIRTALRPRARSTWRRLARTTG